ncbi:MAG TPA: SDR family oxidoreductase [Gemmatimonadaceae bacterium]|mgnify:CR=1 FL=1|nr:SDR family oxidoreductase [Gemmatimonadaceae bacterium]HRQ77692.1 SDR family oxidoreductase [Gemmatimonadaceae bacterium]
MNGGEKRILITGAGGYVGRIVGERLAADHKVVGTDLRARDDLGFELLAVDVRDARMRELMADLRITHVIHLAAVLEGGKDRDREYDIDVRGTSNVVQCAIDAGVRHLTVASSGAAYGYHADNPDWLTEAHPLRATDLFAYAHHKRLVEELLAAHRQRAPQLGQLVLRICTVLGATTDNQITALFRKRRILGVRGSASRFVFVWDEDVAGAILHGVRGDRTGVYNLAGDGAMEIHEIAAALGKPTLMLPAFILRQALEIGQFFHLSRYGPEQLDFLRYRPVLDNRRLKDVFGYRPMKTSAEAFQTFAEAQRGR